MTKDMDSQEYFLSQRPNANSAWQIYARIARAMYMHGGITMNRLCQMTDKELDTIRGIGDKAREVIKAECKNYLKTIATESRLDDEG